MKTRYIVQGFFILFAVASPSFAGELVRSLFWKCHVTNSRYCYQWCLHMANRCAANQGELINRDYIEYENAKCWVNNATENGLQDIYGAVQWTGSQCNIYQQYIRTGRSLAPRRHRENTENE